MRVLNLTPHLPEGQRIRVLDISDDPVAVAAERARFGNRPVSEYPAPGWYLISELEAAGLRPVTAFTVAPGVPPHFWVVGGNGSRLVYSVRPGVPPHWNGRPK